jgi:hypothetical protein
MGTHYATPAVNSPLSLRRADRAPLERAGGCQPHDGQMTDAVAPGDVHRGCALPAPRQGPPRLMGVELWRASKAHTMAARTIYATKPWFFEKGGCAKNVA